VSRWQIRAAAAGFLSSWAIIKDIVLTAGGLTLIMVEVFAVPEPSDAVIVTGLAMSGIGASFHVGQILSGFVGRSSGSEQPPSSGALPSSTSTGASNEHRGK
jgi:hypothetical protein